MAEQSTETKPAKRKLNLSPAEIEARRARMKKMREEGKVGPQFGKLGGRPKKPRASEIVAREAEKNGAKIAKVFIDAIDDRQPMSTRLKGAEGILKVESDQRRIDMQEEEHEARMGKDELLDNFAKTVAGNPMVLSQLLSSISPVDADSVEEIADAEVVDSGDD